jgi:hypothetical protein
MTVSVFDRIVVAAGIGAVVLFGLSLPTSAHPQPQQDQARHEDQKDANQQKAAKRAQQEQDKPPQQAQTRREQEQRGRLARQPERRRLTPEDQQERIVQQQQRSAQYREHLGQQQVLAQQRAAQLQRQNRTAQFGIQQQYLTRLRQQQFRIPSQGSYDYGGDPFFSTAPSYRYARAGRFYETNQYGVELLRQAVSYGYDEGCRAGLADQQDRWASNYEDSFAYQDASYGYTGFYVDRDDYNNFFREGFRRGYEDSYDGRYRYGRYASGRWTILDTVLVTILNVEVIR